MKKGNNEGSKKQIPAFKGYSKISSVTIDKEKISKCFIESQMLSVINKGNIKLLTEIIENNLIDCNLMFKIQDINQDLMNCCVDSINFNNSNDFDLTGIYNNKDEIEGDVGLIFLLSFLNQSSLIKKILEKNKNNVFNQYGLKIANKNNHINKDNDFMEWAIIHDNLEFFEINKNFYNNSSKEMLLLNILNINEKCSKSRLHALYPKNIYKELIKDLGSLNHNKEQNYKFIQLLANDSVNNKDIELLDIAYEAWIEDGKYKYNENFDMLQKIFTKYCVGVKNFNTYLDMVIWKNSKKDLIKPFNAYHVWKRIKDPYKSTFFRKIKEYDGFSYELEKAVKKYPDSINSISKINYAYEYFGVFNIASFKKAVFNKETNGKSKNQKIIQLLDSLRESQYFKNEYSESINYIKDNIENSLKENNGKLKNYQIELKKYIEYTMLDKNNDLNKVNRNKIL